MREWVGLLFLAIGIVVAASFYFPETGNSSDRRQLSRGEATHRTGTAVPEGAALAQPASWTIALTRGRNNLPVQTSVEQQLAVAYDRPPVAELEDSNWGVAAEGQATASAGRHTFRLTHLGSLRVYVNGELVAEAPSPDDDEAAAEAVVTFIQEQDGTAQIRIEARAEDDRVSLAWRG